MSYHQIGHSSPLMSISQKSRGSNNSPAEPIVIDEEDEEETLPKRKRSRSVKPSQVMFPADLPPNVVELIRTWQIVNRRAAVPSEIYCIQTPRIFKDKGDKTGKDIEYIHAQTGRRLFVRAFSLDWMRKGQRPKNSERLLVAFGSPLTASIVLARARPYSNEFRSWGGVNDDVTAQAVVIRRPVRDESNEAFLEQPKIQDYARIVPQNGILSTEPMQVSQDSIAHEDTAAVDQTSLRKSSTSRKTRTLDAVTHEKVSRTFFHFRSSAGNALRIRTALQCQTYHSLFANAVAGGVIAANERFPVLDCNVTLTDGSVHRQVIADGLDFAELVDTIVKEQSWVGPGESCVIVVNRFSGL